MILSDHRFRFSCRFEIMALNVRSAYLLLDSLSCQLLIEDDADSQLVLQQAVGLIEQNYKIKDRTIQVETSRLQHGELQV